MVEDRRARLMQWLASGEASLQPLTFSQRELWEASPVPPGDVANHVCSLISVKGMLTPKDCETAVQRVVERQEVLRTSILPGKERPVQMVRANMPPNFEFRELTEAEKSPEAMEELAKEIFYGPFDMLQGPLYRIKVLRRSVDEHVMVFTIHHAISDGWTLGVFIQDLAAAYVQTLMGVQEKLPPPPQTYSAWSASERAFWTPAELAKRAAFWKPRLAGTQRLSNATGIAGMPERTVFPFPAELGKAAKELARKSGATFFNTLLAAFQVALAQWTGLDDIVVGTPVANRTKQTIRETMGYCSGVVPLRGKVDRARSFAESLREVNQDAVDCFANAMPFAELVRAIGEPVRPGRNPIFDVRFALQNYPVPDIDMPGLSARLKMRSPGTPRYALGCEVTEQGEMLDIGWLYRTNLFSPKDIEELNRLYLGVLTAACRSPESRIADLMILPS
jgi:hypothetical protein